MGIFLYGHESKPWHPRYPKVDGTAGTFLHPVVWCHVAIIKGNLPIQNHVNSEKKKKNPTQSHKMIKSHEIDDKIPSNPNDIHD